MSASLFEQFLESIKSLPCDVTRSLSLIRDLDEKVQGCTDSADEKVQKYLNDINELTPETKSSSFAEISNLLDKANAYSEDKKEIARQLYDMVDKHIRRLDHELSKFNYDKLDSDDEENQVKKKRIQSTSKVKGESTILEPEESSSNRPFFQGVKRIKASPSDLADMDIDPNEPLYCICHQVSFGEMVGCDEGDCQIEWFHFSCVGLTSKPKGKWYCPQCTLKRKSKQQ